MIGKVCMNDPSMMDPNGNYLKFFPDAELPDELPASSRSGCLKIGAWIVIKNVIENYRLADKIGTIIGKDNGLFRDLEAYVIVAENNAAQYYPDYAYNHPLFTVGMKVYSDSKVSRFLPDVGRDDSINFQNERNKIYNCLTDRMKEIHKKKNYMTVPAAIKELDKIELIRQLDGVYRLDHAVTATQKDILRAFNLMTSNVKKEAAEIARQLREYTA